MTSFGSEFIVAVLNGEWIARWKFRGSMNGMKCIRCWVMVVQGKGSTIEVERMHSGFRVAPKKELRDREYLWGLQQGIRSHARSPSFGRMHCLGSV